MADAITIKALQDASLDAKSLEEVVNGDEAKQVTTRLGETYPSVKKAIKAMFDNGGLPATPFKTKALMTASALVDGDYAQVTDDTVNNGLYVKTAGAWVKSAYSPVNLPVETIDVSTSVVDQDSLLTTGGVLNTINSNWGFEVSHNIKNKGYYNRSNGNLVVTQTVFCTDKIIVTKGDILKLRFYVDELTAGYPAALVFFDSNGAFTGKTLYSFLDYSGQTIEAEHTVEADGFVGFSTYITDVGSEYIKIKPTNRVLTNSNEALKKVNSVVEHSIVNAEFNAPDVFIDYATGDMTSIIGGYFHSTDFIRVGEGSTIDFKLFTGSNSGALYAFYDENKSHIESHVFAGSNKNILVEDSTVSPYNGYVRFSNRILMPDGSIALQTPYARVASYTLRKWLLPNDTPDYQAPSFTHYGTTCVISSDSKVLLSGASFGSPSNAWFELMCTSLGVTAVNKAVNGHGISNLAISLFNGTFYNQDLLDNADALMIMHVWNYDIMARKDITISGVPYTEEEVDKWTVDEYEANGFPMSTSGIRKADMTDAISSALFDYTIKKIHKIFYDEKLKSGSRYYLSKAGKPVKVVMSTHWHDARVAYNTSVRAFCGKWGLALAEFDTNIGFSANDKHPSLGQESVLYSIDTEVIGDVTYGIHFVGGTTKEIPRRLAATARKVFVVL